MFEREVATAAPRKRDATRARIRDAAIASFLERGYDRTTLRLVADECGLAVGSAYYHFPSKQHLVQELFLDAVQQQHRDATAAFAGTTDLLERLRIAMTTGLASLAPYSAHAGEYLAAMTAPGSPVNPLSPESGPAREIAIDVFRAAVDGSRQSLPKEVAAALPEALWTAYLLLALFWVSDASPGRARTDALLDRGLKLGGMLLPLLRLPVLRGPIREALGLVAAARS
jgi:AcrR family transcriptional regulator